MLQRPNKAQTRKLSPNDGTQRHPSETDPWAREPDTRQGYPMAPSPGEDPEEH